MMGQFPRCEVKLCDLEISRVILEGNEIREILGTPDYVAPEILHYDPITLAADMWSLGVTTYVLLTGFSPFGGETDQETFCNISRGDVDLPEELFGDISDEALNFIKALLVKNPKARLSASQCLKHPWLSKVPPTSKPTPPPAASPSTLRKYLSKSREALFERVVQQHRNSLRKHTLQNQLINKSRLYESQMSLTSKSRERLMNHDRMSPSFSKSIEKIYGLRSLSKSQEVLNLYKNGSLLTSQENLNHVVTEILRSRENLIDKDCDYKENKDKDRRLTRATTADLGILRHRHRKLRIYSGSSTTSITSDMQEEDEDRMADAGAYDDDDETKEIISKTIENNEVKMTTPNANSTQPFTVQPSTEVINNDKDKLDKIKSTNGVQCNEKKNDSENAKVEIKLEGTASDDDSIEEPRFTVAQLVTAFNKHQEIVTKTSLEVTMTAQQKENKLPPILPYDKTPFPTGPTALRLFIPDIDLIHMPRRNKARSSFGGDSNETAQTEGAIQRSDSHVSEANFILTAKTTNNKDVPGYIRSTSQSSEASTAISTEDTTTPDSSLEPSMELTETKPPVRPSTLQVQTKRSKSQSPSPVCETERSQVRKLSAGSYTSNEAKKPSETSRKTSTSSTPTRKLSNVEKSPVPLRRNKQEASPTAARKLSTDTPEFKIVGLGEKSRKGHGIGYKIEFASPLATRRFPVRTPGVCAKTTISSELKKQDNVRPRRK